LGGDVGDEGNCKVELSFETEELREACEKRAAATTLFGVQTALDLERCLADVNAARTVAEFEALFPHLIACDPTGDRSIEFASGRRIRFRAGHVKVPMTPANTIDWQKVTRIRLLEFGQ
jgi:hypothetical protein